MVLQLLPVGTGTSTVVAYCVAFALWGGMISWAGSACTSPIFSEVVPSQQRTIVFSFDRAFEGEQAQRPRGPVHQYAVKRRAHRHLYFGNISLSAGSYGSCQFHLRSSCSTTKALPVFEAFGLAFPPNTC